VTVDLIQIMMVLMMYVILYKHSSYDDVCMHACLLACMS